MATLSAQLRDARMARNWSQRDMSERAGIPQAHISRIESGAIDPQVSTVQDLARALDLEMILAPRTALGAVDAVVRETNQEVERRRLRDIAARMYEAATALKAMSGGLNDRLAEAAEDLGRLDRPDLQPWVRKDILTAALSVDEAVKARSTRRLQPAVASLQKLLTDALKFAGGAESRPAYTLDDED